MKLNRRKPSLRTLTCITAAVLPVLVHGQVHISALPENSIPALSTELHKQGHHAISAQTARQLQLAENARVQLNNPADLDRAAYNRAMAGLIADRKDGTGYAQKVMNETPNPAYNQRIGYELAHYYFKKDKYAEAIKYYEMVGIHNLDNDETGDQKFELAYCYFNNKQFDKAKPLFAAIKSIKENKYYMAGNYYYGLLCYNENKYDEALLAFDVVKNDRDYRAVVPYYIAEIYYFKGDRATALAMADTLINKKEKSFYDKELHLLAAQCHFEAQKYAEAKPYFDYYYEHAEKIRKEDLYEIAYCHYRLDNWKSAIVKFRMLSDTRDSLGQTSMYLLGDCYLKTGDRASARNAFGICADMNFNKSLQEAAMILYGRLSYETGNTDEALRQLKTLLEVYPNSEHKDEAQTLLSGLTMKTGNYEEALEKLQGVRTKDNNYWSVYQKAAYGYGVQLYRKGEMKKAEEYFAQSLQNPLNSEYERAAYFWRAEAAYQLHRYNDAINYAQNFISRMGNMAVIERLSPQSTIQHAYLTMGYSALETGNYIAAQDFFNQAQLARSGDKHTGSVALLLEADAVFLQKNYTKAISLYDRIIAGGGTDVDYAKFQKAILLGLTNRQNDKIALLQSLTKVKPASLYAGNAQYEIALTHMEMEHYKDALAALKVITESESDKGIAPKAWLKTAYIYQQQNENKKAIDAYRKIVLNYPGAEERLPALDALKNLYIQTNQPEQYTQLLKEGNLPSSDNSILDSTYYSAAEAQFAAEKWNDARDGFSNYLNNYPNGVFATKAHFYLGESNYKLRKNAEALTEYEAVLATPWNDFSEISARRAANIAMDLRKYEQAYKIFTALRNNSTDEYANETIYRGLMKSGFMLGKQEDAGRYADSLLAMGGVSTEAATDAKYVKARLLQLSDRDNEAIEAFKQLAGNKSGDIAAESRYRIAEILLKQDKLKEAEEAANETVKLSAGNDNWVGKAYILLADVLLKQKDYFNAKALLQSIVKNTKVQELKVEAAKKLEEVKKAEKSSSKLSDEK